ncbi:hypothetical protein ACIRPH_06695 [Nocardiopsis sp. NPDC101807]|uniref:hypothetical protein n=1 Tax=Nocardiopsis sp. NPDC101807 TaxID=3364339 RepID=UPI00380DC4A3
MTDAKEAPFTTAPVEYGAAVERYLSLLRLGDGSRRVYRIALATWAWPLIGEPPPADAERPGAPVPTVALTVLEDPRSAGRLRAAAADRAMRTRPRTLQRELSILRGAVSWWCSQGWIRHDPTRGLHGPAVPAPERPLSPRQVRSVFALPAGLREQTLWRLVYETAAPVGRLLSLSVPEIDHVGRRSHWSPDICWGQDSARLLALVTLGRVQGPVFLTERRVRASGPGQGCVFTGRGRLSHRRAAELFTGATRGLDPLGRGWPLRRLRVAGRLHTRAVRGAADPAQP